MNTTTIPLPFQKLSPGLSARKTIRAVVIAALLNILVWTGMLLLRGYSWSTVHPIPGGKYIVMVRPARELNLPPVPGSSLGIDSNNAIFWDGETMFCLVSHNHPYRSQGSNLTDLQGPPVRVQVDNDSSWIGGGRWAEAVFRGHTGRLYMWYHNEPHDLFPGNSNPYLTAPRIGQMYSDDDGLNWHDQGIILAPPADSFEEETANLYFGGGLGDFSVVTSPGRDCLYFFLSTYNKDVREQGVAAARILASDLDNPIGKAMKWYDGHWEEPGLGGHVTPIFPAIKDWHTADAQAFWGPSVHWNTHIESYVMLLNLGIDSRFGQEGIYVSLNPRLDDPNGWTEPIKILDTRDWYPQVVGMSAPGHETDRRASRVARLFVKGESHWEIEFLGTAE